MNILIVTGGTIQKEYIKKWLQNKKFHKIIAADAGLSCLDELEIRPTEILGDFDSLKNHDLLEKYREKQIPIMQFPARKDYTDTHLAIAHALDLLKEEKQAEKQPEQQTEKQTSGTLGTLGTSGRESSVTIFGALGTRMDHCLANIGLLARFADLGIAAAIEDEHNRIEMIKGSCKRYLDREKERPYVSLVSFSEKVTGITLEGFSYPLADATLEKDVSLGISNELIKSRGKITVKSGYLLVIQARD